MFSVSARGVQQALRGFARRPGFTAITLVTLALGIGANTAVFSVVDGVLLEALPYPESERLVAISHSLPGLDLPWLPSATGNHLVYRAENRTFEEVALYRTNSANLTGDGAPQRIRIGAATPSLFRVLGVDAALGRTFTEEEGLPGEERIVILGHELWLEAFGGDPNALGETVRVDGVALEVIGVLPEGFDFGDEEVRLWRPIRIDPAAASFGGFNFPSIGRLRPGVEPATAAGDLQSLLPRVTERFEQLDMEMVRRTGLTVNVEPYRDVVVGDVDTALWILLGTVGFVLLIACANVANLLLVRAESRRKELVIRSAMGADRKRLFGLFMVEGGALAGVGGLLGLLLAAFGVEALVALGPDVLPRVDEIGIDASVLVFTAAISALGALVFAAIPLLRGGDFEATGVLRDGYRGSTSTAGSRTRTALVVSQVALALILLVGSGLMVRSFARLQRVDPGFRSESVLTFRVSLPHADYESLDAVGAFHGRFLERLEGLAGVEVAGVASYLPLTGFQAVDPLIVAGRIFEAGEVPPVVASRAATSGYFEALGIPLRRGRTLTRADAESRAPVALLSERAAEIFFPDEEPLGREVAQGLPDSHDDWTRVVGVVGNVHYQSLTEPPMGTIYYAIPTPRGGEKEWLVRSMAYAVRTSVPPTSLVPAVRRVLAELDPDLPLSRIRTMEQVSGAARAQMRFTMLLLGIAAAAGLLLGSVGLYGVIAYVTVQRTREIGVRMALGADASTVRGMVMRQGLAVTFAGIVVGLTGAWALSRFMQSVLYEVSATDPVTFGGVTLVLLSVAAAATWLPARRAAATDPVDALRWG